MAILKGRAVWLGIASPEVAGIAALAGAEIGVVDTEHGQINPETQTAMIRALIADGAKTHCAGQRADATRDQERAPTPARRG